MTEYPFHERRKRGLYFQVVELAVEGGVPDIRDHVVGVHDIRPGKAAAVVFQR